MRRVLVKTATDSPNLAQTSYNTHEQYINVYTYVIYTRGSSIQSEQQQSILLLLCTAASVYRTCINMFIFRMPDYVYIYVYTQSKYTTPIISYIFYILFRYIYYCCYDYYTHIYFIRHYFHRDSWEGEWNPMYIHIGLCTLCMYSRYTPIHHNIICEE